MALQRGGLLDGIEWHASTPFEADAIRTALRLPRHASIHIAPDLGSLPDQDHISGWGNRASGAALRICFLSRISPMKNLAGAIQAVAKMHAPAHLTVYGAKEDAAYWTECERAASRLPPHIKFSYGGILLHEDVYQHLSRHDVFLLPTLGENYGHAILEALSVGLPVVISDQTPWRDLARKGIGYDGPLEETAFARRLDQLAAFEPDEQRAMRERCRQFAIAVLTDPVTVDRNRRLFSG